MYLCFVSQSWLTVTLPTVACWVPLSMGFFKQEYWSGLPSLPPGDLPNPGIEFVSPVLQANSLPADPSGKPQRFCIQVKWGLCSNNNLSQCFLSTPNPTKWYFNYLIYYIFHLHIKLMICWFIGFLENCIF